MRSIAGYSVNSPLPYVSIIMVNYGKGWLPRCLPSVGATDYPRSRLEIIIVDNASSDDLASIKETFPEVKLRVLSINYLLILNERATIR